MRLMIPVISPAECAPAAGPRLLATLLAHARAKVPYYRTNLPVGMPWESLPTLSKAILREQFETLKAEDIAARPHTLNSSGGSTGQPITLVQDAEFRSWSLATQAFYYERVLGIRYSAVPKVIIWGSERDIFGQGPGWKARLQNWWHRRTFLNSFRMTPADMRQYIGVINARRPVLLKGYAGSLYQLAKFAREQNLAVHQPQVIYSAAETLQPFMRQEIESVFRCVVCDFYGSREVGPMAAQCRRGKMHLFTFNNLVEVVDEQNRPVPPGATGRILVTTLHNFAMPLIRYEIGDTAVPGGACDCGLSLPTLERVTGRVTDHFVKRDGTLVHGEYFTHLFYFREWVTEFQVLQREHEIVDVYYVARSPVPSSDQTEIEGKIRLVLGPACRVNWHPVESVPRTPQGKVLFTRTLVQSPAAG